MWKDTFTFNKNVACHTPVGYLKVWGFNLQRNLLGCFVIAFCQQQLLLCPYNVHTNKEYGINIESPADLTVRLPRLSLAEK
jgi:hypothetical protein